MNIGPKELEFEPGSQQLCNLHAVVPTTLHLLQGKSHFTIGRVLRDDQMQFRVSFV